MFGSCPVVRIVYDNPEGFCEINESDFDPKKHELFEKKMGVAELREALTAKGIEFDPSSKKADLQALLA